MATGRRLAVVTALVVGSVVGVQPAVGQEPAAITTTFLVEDADGERAPVPDVEIQVEDADGRPIGTDASDAEGTAAVEVPTPGTYTVALDPRTLPDGIELRDASNLAYEVTVSAGEVQRVLFALAADATPDDEPADEVADDDGGGGSTPWVPVAGAVVIIGLGVGLVLWRRRSSGGPTSGQF